jgi:hypothetical protein
LEKWIEQVISKTAEDKQYFLIDIRNEQYLKTYTKAVL